MDYYRWGVHFDEISSVIAKKLTNFDVVFRVCKEEIQWLDKVEREKVENVWENWKWMT